MNLLSAYKIASRTLEQLAPFCDRAEIAGSIRRGKPEVKDIEIVAIPTLDTTALDLFGNPLPNTYPLYGFLETIFSQRNRKIKGGLRYCQYALGEGINLDLFLVLPPSEWGVQFMLRTGPAEFSHWLVTLKRHGGALPSYLRCINGALYRGLHKISTPTEMDVFNVCGLDWIEPADRKASLPVRQNYVL